MSTATVAVLALGANGLATTTAVYLLLRQGGGVQVKPVPAVKVSPQAQPSQAAPVDLNERRTA